MVSIVNPGKHGVHSNNLCHFCSKVFEMLLKNTVCLLKDMTQHQTRKSYKYKDRMNRDMWVEGGSLEQLFKRLDLRECVA